MIPKNEPDFFDFDSNEDYRLFGDAEATLNSAAVASSSQGRHQSGETPLDVPSPTTTDNSLSDQDNTNKKTKNKVQWNEMEKYLFHKGLELFGPNWKKISKFISTKNSNQVRNFHHKWSETANVIQECDDLTNNYSFVPVTSTDALFMSQFEDPLGLIETATTTISTTPMESKLSPNEEKNIPSINDIHSCTDEALVSSFNDDWNIGCEVLISDTVDNPPISCEKIKKKKKNVSSKKSTTFNKQIKKPNLKKVSKVKKKKSSVKKNSLKLNLIKKEEKSQNVFQGQLVHLVTEEIEEDDVDIDISDDDELVMLKSTKSSNEDKPSCSKPNEPKPDLNNLSAMCDDSKPNAQKQQIFNFTPPSKENVLDLDSISDEEKKVHYEYFDGKGVKTPERYIKIRNYLINSWLQMKPKYLRKTMARNGLKSCGDVNSIGKIHEYLEKIGTINFGCLETNYTDPLIIGNKPNEKCKYVGKKSKKVDRSDMVRNKHKKRTFDMLREGGGLTISHDEFGEVIDACHISESSKSKEENSKLTKTGLFKLVQCLKYDPDSIPPFSVVVHSYALVTFDIHSHTSYGEVMGLLGGYHDPILRNVHVTIAIPTRAVSSGIECDMCPISQSDACTRIHESGVQVIGWYHSHPTFPPNPSIQDIETQSQMQTWFAKQDSPFLGIIISPFCPTNVDDSSQIQCLILDRPSSYDSTNKEVKLVPYRLNWEVTSEISADEEEIGRNIRTIVEMGRENLLGVKWRKEWRPCVTFWEKALKSIEKHLSINLNGLLFCESIKSYFLSAIKFIKDL